MHGIVQRGQRREQADVFQHSIVNDDGVAVLIAAMHDAMPDRGNLLEVLDRAGFRIAQQLESLLDDLPVIQPWMLKTLSPLTQVCRR